LLLVLLLIELSQLPLRFQLRLHLGQLIQALALLGGLNGRLVIDGLSEDRILEILRFLFRYPLLVMMMRTFNHSALTVDSRLMTSATRLQRLHRLLGLFHREVLVSLLASLAALLVVPDVHELLERLRIRFLLLHYKLSLPLLISLVIYRSQHVFYTLLLLLS